MAHFQCDEAWLKAIQLGLCQDISIMPDIEKIMQSDGNGCPAGGKLLTSIPDILSLHLAPDKKGKQNTT